MRARGLVLCLVALAVPGAGAPAAGPTGTVSDPGRQDAASLEELLAAERRDADLARRRGDLRAARRTLDEHLDDEPGDAESRTLRALVRRESGDWDGALADARRALEDSQGASPALRAECGRNVAHLLVDLGRASEAVDALRLLGGIVAPQGDARDAWALGRALWEAGQREEARAVLRQGMEGEVGSTWQRLLARARCERRLGFLERASRSLVAAEERPGERDAPGRERLGLGEPDILAELASVYFEADGEVSHAEASGRSLDKLYGAALERHGSHPASLLGQFERHQVNWMLQRRSAQEFLDQLLAANPSSIEGLVAGARADLEDGKLVSARSRLARLGELAPGRRDVRALEATLAWIEHRRDDAHAALTSLAIEDPADATPELEVGRTLNELYRFPEALGFLRTAVERDPRDWASWTELGRSLANTGDSRAGLEALQRAIELAQGRQDAWRNNTELVLRRMQERFDELSAEGDLSFSWEPDAAQVLAAYQVPFYREARAELAERYGFTPDPVNIQVFDRFQDFSVRSTGFQGFPALGVCFGPVVTAVSPASELRGHFSWARTSFHEFTHVIHLGLSHNRCPRWITEGLATWEEERRNPAWTRNMRRDLVDASANRDLIGVRDLNRAFRGPRILFGYYEGGLLCELLIERHGFPPMIRLLEAFDRGLDLDQALDEVYQATPEEIDREFEAFVQSKTEGLAIEPRWTRATVVRTKLSLPAQPPELAAERAEWVDGWCTVAWGYWQQGARVDAEQALRRAATAGELPPRALFLQGEMALSRGEREQARATYLRGVEAGGKDFRVRMALGRMALEQDDREGAVEHFSAAEGLFPGYPEKPLAAELALAQALGLLGRSEEMYRARERWLAWNADEYAMRVELARWHARESRPEEADRWFREANEIDPFRRALHAEWGAALEALGQHEDALREYRVALLVPTDLDLDQAGPAPDAERARLMTAQARALVALERTEEARATAAEALELDPENDEARALAGRER